MENGLADSNVLVTGGTGFIGSHLVAELDTLGANLLVVDDDSRGDSDRVNNLSNVTIINGDLTDPEVAERSARDADYCFHLAAVVGDVAFMTSNAHRIYENLLIDYNVFEACRKHDVKKVLYTSSACVYPTDLQEEDYAFLSEDDAYRHGANPDGDYGWTKVVGEQMAMSLTEHLDISIATVRPFNPYGPHESFDPDDSHVIPAFIRRAANDEDPFVVWGSGEQVRTFTYVQDLARGMIGAMRNIEGGQVINLSDTDAVTIRELAEIVLDIADHDAELVFDESKPEGVKIRKPDVTNAQDTLYWEPKTSLRDGVRETYEWYIEQTSD